MNVLRINKTQNIKFINDEFKIVEKEDREFKFVGELIAEYIVSSINSFNDEYKNLQNDQEFMFVYDNYSHIDSFSEAKRKIELFSHKLNNDNEFNFIIYLFKLIKSIETNLYSSIKPKNGDYLTYVYNYEELVFTFKFYPDLNTKLVRLDYKGDRLVEFTEYMDFSIKTVGYVHRIFSDWNVKIDDHVYSFNTLYDVKMDTVIFSKILELKKYVVDNL